MRTRSSAILFFNKSCDTNSCPHNFANYFIQSESTINIALSQSAPWTGLLSENNTL